VLRHQRDLLGEVASPATVSRALAEVDKAILTDDVAGVLGRPPATFEAWARDHRDAFRGDR
jgi:hypothetical protein